VLQEILYRYSALGRRDLAGDTLADTDRARDLVTGIASLSVRDAVHAAVMLHHQVEWIASFDAGLDRVPGLRRFELR